MNNFNITIANSSSSALFEFIFGKIVPVYTEETGAIWIDRIVFFVIAGIIIWYFRVLHIKIWIVPAIIFGLGYGLLLRTSGLKIAETLENVFKKGVKRPT